jgi:integrase
MRDRLKAIDLPRLKPGAGTRQQALYADGGGLYLQVRPSGRSWLFRWMRDGKAKVMGLGPFPAVSLAVAREAALDCGKMVHAGLDPLVEREKQKAAERAARDSAMTFKQASAAYLIEHEGKWRDPRAVPTFRATLERHVYPIIGDLPVADIDTSLVLRVLNQSLEAGGTFWTVMPKTAGETRGRIENVLAWATLHGRRSGDNPARWKGHLAAAMPSPAALRKITHQAALPYSEMPTFMDELRRREQTIPALALQFTILTAARTGDTNGAQWSEIDLTAGTWTIPGERMKMKRDHVVPLSPPALRVLERVPRTGDRIFPMGQQAMRQGVLQHLRPGVTVHGFRASRFRH